MAKRRSFVRELVETAILTLAIFFVVRVALQNFRVEGDSMLPNLHNGEYILVNKVDYLLHPPQRGDIVVFKSAEGGDEDLIKRVIGLPGDEVQVRDGVVFVNGERWNEPYVNDEFPDRSFFGPTTVPEGKVFVMGDNRANSRDSRFFGPLPIDNIEGEAFVIFWPPQHIGLL